MGLFDGLSGNSGILGGLPDWVLNAQAGQGMPMNFADRYANVPPMQNSGLMADPGLQQVSPEAMQAWRQGADQGAPGGTQMPPMAQPVSGQAPPGMPTPQPPQGGQMPSALNGLPIPQMPSLPSFMGSAQAQTALGQPGFGDRLAAGGAGFFNAGSPMEAIGNLIGGITTGQRQDARGYGMQQRQQEEGATEKALIDAGVPPQQARAAALNPEILKTVAPNIYNKPQWGVIGQSLLGQPQYGWIDPVHQKVTPAAAAGAPGGADDSKPLFDQLPKAQQGLVDTMLSGKLPAPSAMALKTPYWNNMLAAADEHSKALGQQGFDAGIWGQRNKTYQDFSSGGKSGQSLNALGTVSHHIEKLSNDIESLDNGGWSAVNYIRNGIANNTPLDPARSKAVQAVNDDIKAVTDEMARAYKAGSMSDREIKSWESLISSMGSKTQSRQALADFMDLLDGKRSELVKQHKDIIGTEPKYNNKDVFDNVSKLTHDRNANVTAAPESKPAAGAPAVGTVQKGYRFKGGNPADQASWEKVQ